jgi:hypothetical protein
MNIKLITAQNGDQLVVIGKRDNRFTLEWEQWASRARLSVSAIEVAKRERTPQAFRLAIAAHEFLSLCGISSNDEYEDFKSRVIPNLSTSDAQVMSVCRKCGERIYGRESLLTGYGSQCRRNPTVKKIVQSSKVSEMQAKAVAR